MNNHPPFEDTSNPQDQQQNLARWLQHLLQASTPPLNSQPDTENESQLELLLTNYYHLRFYQQLPDFIMALLKNDPQAATHYAPLLYHLAACPQCHHDYLELYDAMRAAIYPQGLRPVLGQGTRTLAATPQRMLGHLCQTLISQAEAVLHQARHDHTNADASARSLLQLALSISARITQSSIRHQALHNLVRVATLFTDSATPQTTSVPARTYTPTPVGAGGTRGGKKIVRRADMPTRSPSTEPSVIHLQSHTLEGHIAQRDQTLELHLRDLDQSLRGHHLTITIPLGSLLEPVRWLGGNPNAIRSVAPVDATGTLITPLGTTDLQLSNPEEHNLLEAMFMLLEIRPTT